MIAASVDHLWQSTLFALGAALLALALRRDSAGARYALWFAASAKFLVPFSLLAAGAAWMAERLHARLAPAPSLKAIAQWVDPASAVFVPPSAFSAPPGPEAHGPGLGLWLVLAWGLGVAAVCLLWIRRWRQVAAIVQGASPLPSRGRLALACAEGLAAPAVVGLWRPVLVLPRGIGEVLSPEEFEAVLAHELAHVRRRDNVTALIHMAVSALFWFHPLVWWLGHRLFAERERACDEQVVRAGADPEVYARGILKVCHHYLEPNPACAAMSGVELNARVQRIMTALPDRRLNPAKSLLVGLAAAAAVAGPVYSGIWAEAQPAPPARPSSSPGSIGQSPPGALTQARAAPAAEPAAGGPAPEVRRPSMALRAVERIRGSAPEIELISLAATPAESLALQRPAQLAAALAPDRTPASAPRPDATGARIAILSPALRSKHAQACPDRQDLEAMQAQTVSTQFDNRVRRFVDNAVRGAPDYGHMTPGLQKAVRAALPADASDLARDFPPAADVQLADYATTGDDLYLVRHGAPGVYSLVWLNDLGQVDGVLFCATRG